eukprot:g1689.t1
MALRPRVSAGVRPRTAATRVYSHSDSISPKAATTKISEILSDTQDDHAEKKFNWFKNWWAVQVVDDLETDRPNKIQLLNKHYIVWKGHSGDWIAMDDECPHRMAPLSEGRIEKDGNLLCSYHAWRFNESGKCVKIPHAEDEKAHTVACNSSRSAVQTYPCKTRGSLLWIWPDDSVSAFSESSKEPLPIDDDLADFFESGTVGLGVSAYFRLLPYSYDTMMENISDPSHVLVSHHGVAPILTRYKAASMNMKHVEAMSKKPILDAVQYKNPPLAPIAHTEIRLPGVVITYSHNSDDQYLSRRTLVCMSPVSPGRSRVILIEAPEHMILKPKRTSFLLRPFIRFLSYYIHLTILGKVLDSDVVLLHEQDKKLKKLGSQFTAIKNYFIPTDADTLVMSFRNWFEKVGHYGSAFGGDQPLGLENELSKEQLLDRFEQHTKHCKMCLQALSNIRSSISVLRAVTVISLCATGFLLFENSSAAGALTVSYFMKNLQTNMNSSFVLSIKKPVVLRTFSPTRYKRRIISRRLRIKRTRVTYYKKRAPLIASARLQSNDSAVVTDATESIVEEACCCSETRQLVNPFERSASIARGLLLIKPTTLLRRMTTRGVVSRPPTFMAVMVTAAVYLWMSIRGAIQTKVRSCDRCSGFGITRCDLCEGHRVIWWEGKYKHIEPCPKCFGKRYVRCCKCGGLFGRSIFSHKTQELMDAKKLATIEQEMNVDESWIGAPKWVV